MLVGSLTILGHAIINNTVSVICSVIVCYSFDHIIFVYHISVFFCVYLPMVQLVPLPPHHLLLH